MPSLRWACPIGHWPADPMLIGLRASLRRPGRRSSRYTRTAGLSADIIEDAGAAGLVYPTPRLPGLMAVTPRHYIHGLYIAASSPAPPGTHRRIPVVGLGRV